MSGPSTSSERSTVNAQAHLQGHPVAGGQLVGRPSDYQNATDTAAAAVSASAYGSAGHPDDVGQFHQHGYNSVSASAAAAAAAAAQLQHHQLQQQQQQQLHQQFQQFPQHQLPTHHQVTPHHQIQQHHGPPHYTQAPEFEPTGGILHSKFMENEVIKSFSSKQELVKFVKSVLNDEEQCKIVINSSKPKAVYFQCERSGSFRTTVKDSSKRQRVAYTKRNKCGYRLIANLSPAEKDKKQVKGTLTPDGFLDEKSNEFQNHTDSIEQTGGEKWVLRMINPAHNHPPEPQSTKKKRSKFSRTLVEKPLNRANNSNAFHTSSVLVNPIPPHVQHPLVQSQHQQPGPLHHDDPSHHTPSVQDAAVIAAIEATPAAVALHNQNHHVDPNIDPNVDPSVQEHDHSHGNLR